MFVRHMHLGNTPYWSHALQANAIVGHICIGQTNVFSYNAKFVSQIMGRIRSSQLELSDAPPSNGLRCTFHGKNCFLFAEISLQNTYEQTMGAIPQDSAGWSDLYIYDQRSRLLEGRDSSKGCFYLLPGQKKWGGLDPSLFITDQTARRHLILWRLGRGGRRR